MGIDQEHPYHNETIEEALEKLSADSKGLTNNEVKERQEKYGKNVLPEKGGKNVILLFLKQFKDFLILILFIAAAIAWWADHMADVYIIMAVILFNAIMGFVQEYKAEKAIESIKGMVRKKAYVIREGREKEIEYARTGAFLIVAMTQIYNAYNVRSLSQSIFKIGPFTNNWINIAFASSLVLQLLVIKIPLC